MGAACVKPHNAGNLEDAPAVEGNSAVVVLHVYDIGTSGGGQVLNTLLRPLGTGAFHCGVEVYGWEWSYSFAVRGRDIIQGTGIFCCRPRDCGGHTYSQSVIMGQSPMSEDDVVELIRRLEEEWAVQDYDLLTHNCCHFANNLCIKLGVGAIPEWVLNLPRVGAALAARSATANACCCGSQPPRRTRKAAASSNAFCCGSLNLAGAEDEHIIEMMPVRARKAEPDYEIRMPRAHDLQL